MNQKIVIVADVICPWCFIGKRKLDKKLESSTKAEHLKIDWVPFELDPEMPFGGQDRITYRTGRFGSVGASRQMDQKAIEVGQSVGIEFRYDLMTRTPNTFNAHRLIWWASKLGIDQGSIVDALFCSYFLQGQDIGTNETLVGIAVSFGIEPNRVLEFLNGRTGVEEVRKLEQWIIEQDIESVPSYIGDQGKLMQGLDSLIASL